VVAVDMLPSSDGVVGRLWRGAPGTSRATSVSIKWSVVWEVGIRWRISRCLRDCRQLVRLRTIGLIEIVLDGGYVTLACGRVSTCNR
jgi:hypothetical protein